MPKTIRQRILKLLYAKTRSKKNPIFDKWDHFKNPPTYKCNFAKWSIWLKKLKIPKTCKKTFHKNIGVVVCKKPFEKTSNIQEMRRF